MRFLIGDAFLKVTGVTSSLRGDEDEGDTEDENALPFSMLTLTAGDSSTTLHWQAPTKLGDQSRTEQCPTLLLRYLRTRDLARINTITMTQAL